MKDIDDTVRASKAPAIARAAAVLRLLGRQEAPIGVQAIARELGLVPSTCLYVLRALVTEQLVAFDADTKRYCLDAGVLTLARSWLRKNRFVDLAQPILDRISRDFGTTTLGIQISGLDHIIVTAMSPSAHNLHLSTQVGSRFPALVSATGRCIAASAPGAPEGLRQRFEGLRWDNPPTWDDWLTQVDDARQSGVGEDHGNYIAGVTVISTLVTTGSQPDHALVAIGIGTALRAALPQLRQRLKASAQALSSQIAS